MNKNQLKNSELLKINPLVNHNFKIYVNKLTDKKTYSTTDGILLHKQYYFEIQPFTKIVKTPENRILIAGLTNAALKLFNWIQFEIITNQDFILINPDRCKTENKFKSNKTYYNALTELKKKEIIAPAQIKHVYFINPRLFFSGSRVKKYPQSVEVYKPTKKAK